MRSKNYVPVASPPQQPRRGRKQRPSVTTTTDASFENLVTNAIGGELGFFNTSLSTINTNILDDRAPDAGRPADPEGVIFEDSYASFYNNTAGTGQHDPSLDQATQLATIDDNNNIDVNTTNSTDSHSSDSSNDIYTLGRGPEHNQRRVARKNREAGTGNNINVAGTTTSTKLSSTCCWRNCTYWFLGFSIILVGLALTGTVGIVIKIYGQKEEEDSSLSSLNGDDTWAADYFDSETTAIDDIFVPFPSASPTVPVPAPTQAPTQSPSFAPTTLPSSTPSIRGSSASPSTNPSRGPSNEPSSIPSNTPTSPPRSIGPTTSPSFTPSRLASSSPSRRPSSSPTRQPVDLTDSRFLVYLQDVVDTPETLKDISTPQGRALEWLEYEDQFELDILELTEDTSDDRKEAMLRNLYQRFALLTLDFALHDTLEGTKWSFPRVHVCLWTGIKCNVNSDVTGINWARQDLPGTLPNEIGLLTNVASLDIAQNQVKGTLDPLYKLTKAKDIFIFENQLTGSLTTGLENCRNLTRFMAGHNFLSGHLPSLQMRRLRWFNVHHNKLTGSIPSTLALDKVKIFDISNNQIGGTIPANFVEDVIPNIRHLHIENNQINGTVPENFVNLGKGRVLQIYMNDNLLTGGFPSRFEEVKHLCEFVVSRMLGQSETIPVLTSRFAL